MRPTGPLRARSDPASGTPSDPGQSSSRFGLVWDLDGTLVDSRLDIHHALVEACQSVDLPAPGLAQTTGWIGDGIDRLAEKACLALAGSCQPALAARIARHFRVGYGRNPCQLTRPFAPVPELVRCCARAGWRQSVATNKDTELARRILAETRLLPWFDPVIGPDRAGSRKPDPGMLRLALDAMGTRPDRSVMIGDSAQDRQAALACGMRFLAVEPDPDSCTPEQMFVRIQEVLAG